MARGFQGLALKSPSGALSLNQYHLEGNRTISVDEQEVVERRTASPPKSPVRLAPIKDENRSAENAPNVPAVEEQQKMTQQAIA